MGFASIDISSHRNVAPRFKIAGLLEQLPPEDALALKSLMGDPDVPYAQVQKVIRSQAPNYPDIHPSYFELATETVRKHCMEVRGL